MASAEHTIPLQSNDEAILVLGPYDRYAKLLRQSLEIELYTRGGNLRLEGAERDVETAAQRIEHLLGKHRKGRELEPREIEAILTPSAGSPRDAARRPGDGPPRRPDSRGGSAGSDEGYSRTPSGPNRRMIDARAKGLIGSLRPRAIEPRSQNQRRYLEAIENHSLVFGAGAAGTGKTYLAAAAAIRALRSGLVRRLIITRPVVEAGERLGFLPGDLQAKLDPYMRPIYDALYEIVSFEEIQHLEEMGVIEIAPLAYMRGRTLSHAFVLLDEAQNATIGQMKMFLTRLGEGSRMVVTGDPLQTDLESQKRSGLPDAIRRMRGFAGISVVEFSSRDIVRHPLVEQIVRAYDGRPEAGDGADEVGEQA